MTISRIDNYIFKDNFIPLDVCNSILDESKSIEWEKHSWTDITTGNEVSNATSKENEELDVSFEQRDFHQTLSRYVNVALSDYHKHVILDNDVIHFFSNIRMNKYEPGSRMNKHIDHITSLFDGSTKGIPVLSIVGVLNDDYKGGEFVMWDNYTIRLKAGDILIFPSNFMYPHKINTIVEGTRYSFVCWAW